MGTEQKYYPATPPSYSYDNPQIPGPQMAPMPAPGQPLSGGGTTNVIVVNQQPVADTRMIVSSVIGHRDWSTDLCACMNDAGGCLWTCFCTCCVLADISAKLRENVCVTCCVPGSLITLRTRLRTLGGIQGSICKDYCAISCCYLCAICQMSRELTAMGL